jgi:hypothetical protein
MPKYKTCEVEGYWEDNPEDVFTVKVAYGSWDEVEDDEDQSIFFYLDGAPIKVGDTLAEGFIVTEIN